MGQCLECHEDIPEGTVGPFCSNECKWRHSQKGEHDVPMRIHTPGVRRQPTPVDFDRR